MFGGGRIILNTLRDELILFFVERGFKLIVCCQYCCHPCSTIVGSYDGAIGACFTRSRRSLDKGTLKKSSEMAGLDSARRTIDMCPRCSACFAASPLRRASIMCGDDHFDVDHTR